jgi:histidinol-phosphate aminotransferase
MMDYLDLPIRADLAGLEPYGAPQLDLPVRLNVNEFPYAPQQSVVDSILKAVAEAAGDLNRYPDRDFDALRVALAGYLNTESHMTGPAVLKPENIWAGNGSNEVMLHLFQAFGGPGRAALTFGPTYSMYPEYARDAFTEWHAIERNQDFCIDLNLAEKAIKEAKPALIILCSPNNPSGTALTLPEIENILTVADSVIVPSTKTAKPVVIVDEAYGEFRRAGTPSALKLLPKYPNLAVSRTMSKAFGAAGLRLGYLAASPKLIDCLRLVRLPYHLSAITQAAATAALGHAKEMQAQVAEIRDRRDALELWLSQQKPIVTTPSDANFVMFGKFADRHEVWQELTDQGILIREVGPPGWLRVTVGTEAETEAFKSALTQILTHTELLP